MELFFYLFDFFVLRSFFNCPLFFVACQVFVWVYWHVSHLNVCASSHITDNGGSSSFSSYTSAQRSYMVDMSDLRSAFENGAHILT
jgi:hypothetical protein